MNKYKNNKHKLHSKRIGAAGLISVRHGSESNWQKNTVLPAPQDSGWWGFDWISDTNLCNWHAIANILPGEMCPGTVGQPFIIN